MSSARKRVKTVTGLSRLGGRSWGVAKGATSKRLSGRTAQSEHNSSQTESGSGPQSVQPEPVATRAGPLFTFTASMSAALHDKDTKSFASMKRRGGPSNELLASPQKRARMTEPTESSIMTDNIDLYSPLLTASPGITTAPLPQPPLEPQKHSSTRSGKGQNEMLSDWFRLHASHYLARIVRLEHISHHGSACSQCHTSTGPFYHCRDCIHSWACCKDCLHRLHTCLPTHRIREWKGTHFVDVSLASTGYRFHLGHGGRTCQLGVDKQFTIGSTQGIQVLTFRFCAHASALTHSQQLIESGIYPCSDENPSSGFTFDVLRTYHLLACEAKLPAQRYFNVLVHRSNTLHPDEVPDRYREFLRVSRQWMFLMDLKRSGSQVVTQGGTITDLAVRCPACPNPQVNFNECDVTDDGFLYVLHVSFDGSFQLYRKDKPADAWDLWLTTGRKYFVPDEEFQIFLDSVGTKGNMSTKDASCNNHRAAQGGWVKFNGLAETGLGSVICARHGFFMPRGTVNFTTGERYSYPDYVYGSVLNDALSRGVKGIGIHYDIMCHYLVNMWARFKHLEPSLRVITPDTFETFITAVPKFHLAGHTDGCFLRFSLNYLTGVGRLDSEGNERCWANLNHAASATCERSPGSRMELLEHIMSMWNWIKKTGLARWILTKWNEACRMRDEMSAAFKDFDSLFDRTLISSWSDIDTSTEEGRLYFLMPDPPDMSLQKQVQRLVELEASTDTSGPPVGCAEWLAEGISIQSAQYYLKHDVESYGEKPNGRKSTETKQRRKELSDRLDIHKTAAPPFLNPLPPPPPAIPSESQGIPEDISTSLPSDYPEATLRSYPNHTVVESERALRRTYCLKTLQTLRSIAVQQSHVSLNLSKQRQGTRSAAKLSTMNSRFDQRLTHARWLYNDSYRRLKILGMTAADSCAFKELTASDIESLTQAMTKRRPLGEGRIKLPWYWRVDLSIQSDDSDHVYADPKIVDDERHASFRVAWFRARERHLRWKEEVGWLQRESASLVLSFHAEGLQWLSLSRNSTEKSWQAYCHRQHATRQSLTRHAWEVLQPILTSASGPGSKLCQRVCVEFADLFVPVQ